jgi:hypothetical protein
MSKRAIVLSCLGCLVAGYLAASVPGFDPVNPFNPRPQRPFLKFVSRLAKLGLWMTVFAEPAPRPVEQQYAAAHCGDRSLVCHAEGW